MTIIASHFLGILRIIIIIILIILTPQNKPRQQLKYTNWNKQKIRSMRRILQAGKVKSRPRPRPAMCVCVCVSLSLSLSLSISRASSIAEFNPWALFGRWLSCHLLSPGTDGANTYLLTYFLPSLPSLPSFPTPSSPSFASWDKRQKRAKLGLEEDHPPLPPCFLSWANFIHHCTLEDGWKVVTKQFSVEFAVP